MEAAYETAAAVLPRLEKHPETRPEQVISAELLTISERSVPSASPRIMPRAVRAPAAALPPLPNLQPAASITKMPAARPTQKFPALAQLRAAMARTYKTAVPMPFSPVTPIRPQLMTSSAHSAAKYATAPHIIPRKRQSQILL